MFQLEPLEFDELTLEALEQAALALLEEHRLKEFWHQLSASQAETFEDCKRKWAFRAIDRAEQEPNPYADVGKKIHEVLEAYLLNGTLPKPGELLISVINKHGEREDFYGRDIIDIITPGMPHLPEPGVARIEGEFFLNTVVGLWKGYKDFYLTADEEGAPVVGDHKSTSDLRWAKTRKALLTDTQAILYAADEIDKTAAALVILRWVYYQRQVNKPKARKVEVKVTCQHVDTAILPVLQTGLEIQRHRLAAKAEGLKAKDFFPSPDACEKFGGCNYKRVCNLTPNERLRAHMAQMSIKDKMKTKMASKASAPATPKEEKPAAAASPKKGKPLLGKSKGAGSAVNPPAEAAPAEAPAPKAAKPKAPVASRTGGTISLTFTGTPEEVKASVAAMAGVMGHA